MAETVKNWKTPNEVSDCNHTEIVYVSIKIFILVAEITSSEAKEESSSKSIDQN